MNIEGLDSSILGPAFAAGLLVLSTHVPLGRQVLQRGIIFIDLAIAQFAGLGVIAAHVMHLDSPGFAVQLMAYGCAVLGAFLLYWCERHWPDAQEAIIGTSFIVAACSGILLLSSSPQAGEHLKELLVGQILWVGYAQLVPVTVIYALVLLLGKFLRSHEHPLLFYLLFAVTVTASVQLVGVYLVFASLIIPALSVRNAGKRGVLLAYGLGAAGYGLGLLGSALFDLPAGAVIVLSLACLGMLVAAIRKVACQVAG
ncbi:metal ABC transporter permease [Gammaproteobacteria bacterium]|nr:metal ABC transporter permease [Gammaproteobacteria bacterium]